MDTTASTGGWPVSATPSLPNGMGIKMWQCDSALKSRLVDARKKPRQSEAERTAVEQIQHVLLGHIADRVMYNPEDIEDDYSDAQRLADRLELFVAHVGAWDPSIVQRMRHVEFAGESWGDDAAVNKGGQPSTRWLDHVTIKLCQLLSSLLRNWTPRKRGVGPNISPCAPLAKRVMFRKSEAVANILDETAHYIDIVPGSDRPDGLKNVREQLSVIMPIGFFPETEPNANAAETGAKADMLPLSYHLHEHWEKFAFSLRPVLCSEDPRKGYFLQVGWAEDITGPDYMGPWSFQPLLPEIVDEKPEQEDGWVVLQTEEASEVDTMRSNLTSLKLEPGAMLNGSWSQLSFLPSDARTGDLFYLSTDSPEDYPLPDLEMMQMQYAVHHLMGRLRRKSTLRAIFAGAQHTDMYKSTNVLRDACDCLYKDNSKVPYFWQVLLKAAVDERVLDRQQAAWWLQTLAKQIRRDKTEWMRARQ